MKPLPIHKIPEYVWQFLPWVAALCAAILLGMGINHCNRYPTPPEIPSAPGEEYQSGRSAPIGGGYGNAGTDK